MTDYSEKHETDAKYLPTPAEIERMKRLIRAENEATQQGKRYQPPVDDDCDAALEDMADRESMGGER